VTIRVEHGLTHHLCGGLGRFLRERTREDFLNAQECIQHLLFKAAFVVWVVLRE
jgi:hypothetical protein